MFLLYRFNVKDIIINNNVKIYLHYSPKESTLHKILESGRQVWTDENWQWTETFSVWIGSNKV